MFDKLREIEQNFVSIEQSLAQGELDGKELSVLTRQRAEMEDLVEAYRDYERLRSDRRDAEEMLLSEDPEMQALAKEEIRSLDSGLTELEEKLKRLMLPKDPNDNKNVILEIRAGTGGEEAAIFAADLMRMYSRFAEEQGWRTELMNAHESAKGGYKEIVVLITGRQVYSCLKFEMGVHRVQRVPATESQGRIHTSACTVAVLPEAEELEIEINPSELRIDTYRSSGAGGQHVNTTDSAVRITHIPTGTVAECQDERSQHKNKAKAMKMLRSRIYEKLQQQQQAEISADRRTQVGSGDRSERIRTYNFPQGRVTDHRINLTLYKLDSIMNGDLRELTEALGAHHTAKLLQTQTAESGRS
ncbi:MAG: peptide chain release factor 1 [Deltaproteobacteria bacterium]|nr:peptide chain release factor 1 [Deltaproteobacteria bacterium]